MDVVDLGGEPWSRSGVDDADRTPMAHLEGSVGELLFKRSLRTEASRAVRNAWTAARRIEGGNSGVSPAGADGTLSATEGGRWG